MPENDTNESTPTLGEVVRRLMLVEDNVGILMETRRKSGIWQGQTDLKLDNISDTLTKFKESIDKSFSTIQLDIKAIADKPAKRLETATTAVIYTGVGSLMGFIVSNLLK